MSSPHAILLAQLAVIERAAAAADAAQRAKLLPTIDALKARITDMQQQHEKRLAKVQERNAAALEQLQTLSTTLSRHEGYGRLGPTDDESTRAGTEESRGSSVDRDCEAAFESRESSVDRDCEEEACLEDPSLAQLLEVQDLPERRAASPEAFIADTPSPQWIDGEASPLPMNTPSPQWPSPAAYGYGLLLSLPSRTLVAS
jgi:hypothetical protein